MAICLFLLAFLSACESKSDYRNPDLPIEKRISDLLSRMTAEEKIAQLRCIYRNKNRIVHDSGVFNPQKAARILNHGIVHIARPSELGDNKK